MFVGVIWFLASPHFDHDAFTHHALHVLDAPGQNNMFLHHQFSSHLPH